MISNLSNPVPVGGADGRMLNETLFFGLDQERLADYLTRLDVIILDELGYLPFRRSD